MNNNLMSSPMSSKAMPDHIQTDCHASREFLLNTPAVPDYRVQPLPPDENQIHRLTEEFLTLATGETLVNQWLEQFDPAKGFGAMVFRIDTGNTRKSDPNPNPGPEETDTQVTEIDDDRLIRLARILNETAQTSEGFWGLMYNGILGLFLLGSNPEDYSRVADKIRTAFNHTSEAGLSIGLSIGLAVYPDDHTNEGQVMGDAVKALDHAAFLGHNTTVFFDAVSLNISGDRLYSEGDIEGSIREFERALKLDASNVNVRNSLGVCYGVLKEYNKALSQFEAAIQSAPGEVMAIYNYGLVKLLIHHPNQALDYFLQAERIRGDIFEVVYHIGKVYVELNEPAKALTYLTRAETLNANTAGVYRLMGRCHADLGAQDQAIAAYTQAVRINPDDAQALSDLGRQYDLRDENHEIAMLFCERSTQIDQNNGRFHHRLGRLYLKAQEPSRALASFEKAHALGFDSQIAIDDINRMLAPKIEKASTM